MTGGFSAIKSKHIRDPKPKTRFYNKTKVLIKPFNIHLNMEFWRKEVRRNLRKNLGRNLSKTKEKPEQKPEAEPKQEQGEQFKLKPGQKLEEEPEQEPMKTSERP